ncbi:4Fe-4S dicluster domain-containing protein [Caldinitratiruptor microaerophilus]|uniref:Nitrate reductase subunit beta n=1 Tax=Caldinitratiruptor microaerophilus TaxID=671077 RepID=A0AA35GB51_9FIRM|nr:4Fe-4S dicluster domain-containing protein [Caldinitratiruptor microaerophilus]BDG61999.1 nitrate reductase subunit beta [Caldinitratiruptor microaerophilus]
MAEVQNWQLGRKMQYPYEEARPERQFAAVFNLNRCIGCQTCTMACKSTWTWGPGQEYMWWNNVETKPYGGYPQNWDVKLLSMLGPQEWQGGVYAGKTIFEAADPAKQTTSGFLALGYLPADEEWRYPNIHEDTAQGHSPHGARLPEHESWFFYLPRICNHCTYPACLAACPRKAIYKRQEDGIVLIDQSRCRGYRKCMEACPYKKPMYRGTTATTEKCVGCYPRIEQGQVTRCIATCIGKIRLFGWVNEESSPVHYLVHKAKVALPLYPQFGTEPNVYYIPPRWVPRDYLRQMFGPGVDAAIEAYAKPSPELLAVLQLFGATDRIIARYRLEGEAIVGFDDRGAEVVRVPIDEKVQVRPADRMNIT